MKQFCLLNDCQVPIEYKIVPEENNGYLENEVEFDPNEGIVDAYTNRSISVRHLTIVEWWLTKIRPLILGSIKDRPK